MREIAQGCFAIAAGIAMARAIIIASDGLTPKVVTGSVAAAFVVVAMALFGASFYVGRRS